MEREKDLNIKLTAKDGHVISVYCWDKVEHPRAVFQIFHGMGEHAGRYERIAGYLNSKGIAVVGDDHRGHGKTALLNGTHGNIGKNGFYNIVEDEYMITQFMKKKYANTPVYIFAHSFGSFIGQEYITRYGNNIDGIILCGSAAQTGVEFKIAKILATVQRKLFGEEKTAKLMEKLSFGSFNKKIDTSDNTNWLSRDSAEVMKYADDPLCGFTCSIGFYYYFTDGLTKLYEKDKLAKIPKQLPVYIIAGEEDPVGNYGKKVTNLYNLYNALNLSDLELKLYKDCRHELLNETNRDDITEDIFNWIESRLARN
ncbi:MAG: pldB [Eubacterium sp.]|jgi:alpha-beta hydrolase superfamily lysophospholipase|nr:pldB [Eubacterium sp.]